MKGKYKIQAIKCSLYKNFSHFLFFIYNINKLDKLHYWMQIGEVESQSSLKTIKLFLLDIFTEQPYFFKFVLIKYQLPKLFCLQTKVNLITALKQTVL